MKKESGKSESSFSREREFAVVLEQLHSDFRTFGEGLSSLRSKVDAIFEMAGKNTEDLTLIKADLRILKTDLKAFGKRISSLEETIHK
jgi:peptidoglycan hydrolase CwlO-like protein